MCIRDRIQIIPVVVSNTSSIYSPRLGIFNRGTINIKVLEPINTDNLEKDKVGELCDKVYKLMNDELKTLGYSEAIVDTELPEDVISYNAQKKASEDTQRLAAAEDDHESIHSVGTVLTNPEPTERTSLLKEQI